MNGWMRLSLPSSPLGIGWGFLYGYQSAPALPFLPELRRLGAGLAKIYLFWNQLEPSPGAYDWSALDAFVEQLESPEEGLISLFASSTRGSRRPAALLPASPARDDEAYARFVTAVVRRCRGRVKYWQNGSEPNSAVFWDGSAEEFAAQSRLFFRAVKQADPGAVVVLGGYDGLFNPPGLPPFPNQQAGLDFFDRVFRAAAGAFDLFDVHLYNDPYTIPASVEYLRERMRAAGFEKPVICCEYGGPAFFAFDENRRYLSLLATWAQSGQQTDRQGMPGADAAGRNQIEELYGRMESLAPQTQMFMQGCQPVWQERYERIQARELVVRTLLGLCAGVQKMVYWQFSAGRGPRADLMDLMYGKIGLVEFEDDHPARERSASDVYARMAGHLRGVQRVERIEIANRPSVYLVRVERAGRAALYVIWEQREAFAGQDLPPIEVCLPWEDGPARAEDAQGRPAAARAARGTITLAAGDLPVYVEAGE